MADVARASSDKLEQALRMADEAVREMGVDAARVSVQKFDSLKEACASPLADRIHRAKQYTMDKAREIGSRVDESVHEKPYHYIAAALGVGAALGVVIGIFVGRSTK